jgi:hypothetical protein
VRRPRHLVRGLRRFPLRTPYPDIVESVRALLERPWLRPPQSLGCYLAVDATGPGAPVVDMLRQARLPATWLVPILITEGDAATKAGPVWHVPKRQLAGVLRVTLEQHRLTVAAELPEAQLLVTEMANFRVKISQATGHDAYGAMREGEHDDLVLAVAMAVWLGERLAGEPRPPAEPYSFSEVGPAAGGAPRPGRPRPFNQPGVNPHLSREAPAMPNPPAELLPGVAALLLLLWPPRRHRRPW